MTPVSICADCGLDVIAAGEWYMVRDEIWEQAWEYISPKHCRWPSGEQILCIGCLEKRIDRELTRDDFTDAPTNAPDDSRMSYRLLTRLGFGPGHYFTPDGRGRQCCDDCRRAFRHEKDALAEVQMTVAAGPILRDDLWATIAENDAFLCFDCTEHRLGRPLTQADLIPCPFNAGWISFDGADVTAMQRARGRRLLPERPE